MKTRPISAGSVEDRATSGVPLTDAHLSPETLMCGSFPINTSLSRVDKSDFSALSQASAKVVVWVRSASEAGDTERSASRCSSTTSYQTQQVRLKRPRRAPCHGRIRDFFAEGHGLEHAESGAAGFAERLRPSQHRLVLQQARAPARMGYHGHWTAVVNIDAVAYGGRMLIGSMQPLASLEPAGCHISEGSKTIRLERNHAKRSFYGVPCAPVRRC